MQDDTHDEGNEIRLVDILAALIWQRKWLVGIAVGGTLLSLILVFGLPLAGIKVLENDSYSIQCTVRAVQIPSEVQSYINFDYIFMTQSEVQDLGLVAEVYKTTLMSDREATMETPEFNRAVKNFIKHNLTVTADYRIGVAVISLKTSVSQRQKGTEFLEQLVDQIKIQQKLTTQPLIQKTVDDMNSSASQGKGDLSAQKQMDFQVKAKALQGVLANPDFPLTLLGSPVVLAEDASISKAALIGLLILGSILLGVVVALVAESLSKMKNDQEVRDLLSRAWKRQE